MVPERAVSPGCFATGIDSPVMFDSSQALSPLITSMSAGICSPVVTRTIIPGRSCPTGSCFSRPSFRTRAVFGAPRKSASIAFLVRPMAKCSMAPEAEKRNRSNAPSLQAPMIPAPTATASMRKWTSSCPFLRRSQASPAASHPPQR